MKLLSFALALLGAASLAIVSPAAGATSLPADAWNRLPPHPRLFANAERFAALRQQVQDDPVSRQLYARIRGDAIEFLTAPPVAYVDTGAFMLGPMGQGQRRIMTLALCYRLEKDARFLDRARQEMKALAALPNWYEIHFLGTAEASMGMGLGLDWLHDELTAEERAEFKTALVKKGLKKSWLPDGSSHKWATANTNWNQVCNGGLAIGAMAIAEEEPALAQKVVARSVANVHFAAEPYAPAGAYPEGVSYWGYGTTFHVLLVEALRTVFNNDCNLERFPGFLESPDFVAHMRGPTGQSFNYADAPNYASTPGAGRTFSPVMFWFARELQRPDLIETELATMARWHEDSAAGKKPNGERHLVFSLLCWDPALSAAKSKPERPLKWSSGGGLQPVVAMRTSWTDPRATFVAFKGGLMPNSHAHMDVGSFVLEADGVRWAIDPGTESYSKVRANGIKNAELFDTRSQDSKRWTIFRKGPEGHNLIRFGGELQQIDGRADIRAASNWPKDSAWVVDLSPIYSRQAEKVERGFALLDDGRVLIQDEWTASAGGADVAWQWLTYAAATVQGSEIMLREKGEALRLRVLANEATIEIQDVSQPRQPFDSPNPGLSRIVVRLKTPAGASARLAVIAEPAGRETAQVPKIRALAEW